jgi:hypothetical protein
MSQIVAQTDQSSEVSEVSPASSVLNLPTGFGANPASLPHRHSPQQPIARAGYSLVGEQKTNIMLYTPINLAQFCVRFPLPVPLMEEGRKRVLGIMAAILASLHMQTADDLFGGPTGSPRSDKLIAVSIQWAEEIMRKIDNVFSG